MSKQDTGVVPALNGSGSYRILDAVKKNHDWDIDDLGERLRIALTDFPELSDTVVTVARDNPKDDRIAGAWSWSDIIFVQDERHVSNVTLYHELGHLAIRKLADEGEDVPPTSERFCSIFSMARMPTAMVDEERIPYLGQTEVTKGLHPKICQEALEYRKENRDYIKQCKKWLNGEWEYRTND